MIQYGVALGVRCCQAACARNSEH